MKKIAIIDYGMGNIYSVVRAVEECGGKPVIVDSVGSLKEINNIILPGVGSFREGMLNLHKTELHKVLTEQVIEKRIPLLGICLGMQILAKKGSEGGETEGFGWIEGEIKRFQPDQPNVKIPHIGWNEVSFTKPSSLFEGIPSRTNFYFVHSYHFICKNEENILAMTPYCGTFASVVGKDNVFGVQFHPEKSLRVGLKLISNFLSF